MSLRGATVLFVCSLLPWFLVWFAMGYARDEAPPTAHSPAATITWELFRDYPLWAGLLGLGARVARELKAWRTAAALTEVFAVVAGVMLALCLLAILVYFLAV